MSNKIRIGIAEDHEIVRYGISQLLGNYNDMRLVFQACDGLELFQKLEKTIVDIVLLDIKMPKIDGEQAIPKLKQLYPKIKIIVISAFHDDDLIIRYSNLGADSFLAKVNDIKMLVKAIYAVRENGFFYEDSVLDLINKKSSSPLGGIKKLNPKEKLVLLYLCEGRTGKEIAKLLGVAESTIGGYKHRIMQKTGANDEAGLLDYAIKHKYIKSKKNE